MQMTTKLAPTFALFTLLVGACQSDDSRPIRSADDEMVGEPTSAPVGNEAEPPPDEPQAAEDQRSEEAWPDPSEEPAAVGDGVIAGVLAAADRREVEVAKVALERSKDPNVRRFANKMIKEHQSALDRLDEVTTAAGITAAVSDRSAELDAGGAIERLRGTPAADVPEVYFGMMVEDHRKVLDFIDEQALPNVDDADLRRVVGEHRMTVDAHLVEAVELANRVGEPAAPARPQPGASR